MWATEGGDGLGVAFDRTARPRGASENTAGQDWGVPGVDERLHWEVGRGWLSIVVGEGSCGGRGCRGEQ